MGRSSHRSFDQQVVEEKIGRIIVIGENAADLCGGHEYCVRSMVEHPAPHAILVAQIDLASVESQHFAILFRKPPNDRRAHHSLVACDENLFACECVHYAPFPIGASRMTLRSA